MENGVQHPLPRGPSLLSGHQARTPWEMGLLRATGIGLWGTTLEPLVVQAWPFAVLPVGHGQTLAGPESGLLGVTEGPNVASAFF